MDDFKDIIVKCEACGADYVRPAREQWLLLRIGPKKHLPSRCKACREKHARETAVGCR